VSLYFNAEPSDGHEMALRVWERPRSQGVYVIGADVAEGLDHGDYSCAQVLDALSGAQVAMWHGHIAADLFGEEVARLGRWYNRALVGVEQNNHGLTTITRLRQLEYPFLYRHKTVDQVSKKITLKYGWPTNRLTKPLMIDTLGAAIREGEIAVYDKRTVGELKTYIRDEMGKMHGSPHDDTVMAMAIAVQMLQYALEHHEAEAPGFAQWSGGWWQQQAETKPSGRVPLGHYNRRGGTQRPLSR